MPVSVNIWLSSFRLGVPISGAADTINEVFVVTTGAGVLWSCKSLKHQGLTVHLSSHATIEINHRATKGKVDGVPHAPHPIELRCVSALFFFATQVTIALADKTRVHVPFRQSKLTHILKVRWHHRLLR